MHSASEMLQNTLKHHFGSNGGYWVCSCENVCRNFGTPTQCISVLKHTSFLSFCLRFGSKILQNTPKHQFSSSRGYYLCSCENVRWNFGTPKQCIQVPKRTSSSSF